MFTQHLWFSLLLRGTFRRNSVFGNMWSCGRELSESAMLINFGTLSAVEKTSAEKRSHPSAKPKRFTVYTSDDDDLDHMDPLLAVMRRRTVQGEADMNTDDDPYHRDPILAASMTRRSVQGEPIHAHTHIEESADRHHLDPSSSGYAMPLTPRRVIHTFTKIGQMTIIYIL